MIHKFKDKIYINASYHWTVGILVWSNCRKWWNDRDYGDEDGMSQVERNETDEEVVVDEICLKW